MLRELKHTLCAPGHRDLTETETELCLSVSWGSIGQQWAAAGALGTYLWAWHKLYCRKSPLTPPQSHHINPTNLHRTGETDSWRAQTEPCAYQDPGERSSDPTKGWPSECPGSLSRGVGRWWPAAGLGALSAAVSAWGLVKEVAIIFIISTIVWPQVKQQGGNTAPHFNRKLD